MSFEALKRRWFYIVLALIGIAVIIDRLHWASVAQWREDQSTNLWLGYTQSILAMPVGLVSSTGIFNPNGMLLLGKLASLMPTLLAISTVLGCLQAGLILWLAWQLFGSRLATLVVAGPVLASVTLRAAGIEFWNQWLLISVNLLLFNFLVLYIKKPRHWKLPLMLLPEVLAPGLYLAGVVNLVVFGLAAVGVILFRPPVGGWKKWPGPILLSMALVGAAILLTWIPYFRAIDFRQASANLAINHVSLKDRAQQAWQALHSFPNWLMLQWFDSRNNFAINHGNIDILSLWARRGLKASSYFHVFQAFLSFCLAGMALVVGIWKRLKIKAWIRPGGEVAAQASGWPRRYVVGYAFDPPSEFPGFMARQVEFGRIRVTILIQD